jgi:hypothetical protein
VTVERLNVTSGPYVGNGATMSFPINFHAASESEVGASINGVDVDRSSFTVALNDDGTGSARFLVAPVGVVIIYSDPNFDQTTNFEDQGPLYQSSINDPIDRSAIRDLVLRDQLSRAPVLPRNSSDAAGLFPQVQVDGSWGLTPGVAGVAGPADAFRVNLAALKAAAITDGKSDFDGSTWYWTTGDYSGRADDRNIVKSDRAALTVGAWIRQQATNIQASFGRNLAKKTDEVASLADKLEIADFDDVRVAAQLAFTIANPGQGRGVTLRAPRKAMFLYEPLVVPALTTIVGAGYRDTFFIPQFDGAMFVFDGVYLSGLRNCRIGMGSGKNVCAIDIKTTSADARGLNFTDLEIAGGGSAGAMTSSVGGQTAVRAFTSGNRIITECVFDRIIMTEIDRPVIMNGPEGNEFTRFVIDQFGYSGQCGMELITHADYYQGRIAGAPAAGTIGYKQGGFRSQAVIRTDIGNGARAIDLLENHGNQVILQRPYEAGPPVIQTPVGNFPPGNTLIDGYRAFARGPSPSVSNFAISGFGDGAAVESVIGDDRLVRFTVRAGTMNYGTPVISYSFAGGPWPYNNAIVSVSRNGGNQNDKMASGASASVNGWGFSPNVTPATGEFYIFQVEVG